MNKLDALISERQKSGASSGRKRFKLARQRAVAKMRKFALADPSFFVLELIQSAIAHGATMLHVGSDNEEFSRRGGQFSLVYGGEHYRREELGQLFDFLFTEKGQLENAHLRDLAIGLNALLSFTPKRIRIVTGDGTLKGSTLMSVEDGGSTIELGRPDEAVRGVHLLASGLRHPSVQGTGFSLRSAATSATISRVVEERCMLTPVPVMLNGEALSGYSSERALPLFGYRKRTELDEGDLYGTIGLTGSYALRGIRIMVRGVWIETIPHPSDTHGKKGDWKNKKSGYLGGAVSFDRLRKTADHAGIVRDERFRELLARLEPYVARARGNKGASAEVVYHGVDGPLTLRETRKLLLGGERAICLVSSPGAIREGSLARALADRLGGPVVATNSKSVEHLTSLSGGDVDILEVRPTELPNVQELLSRAPSPLPKKPWLVEPIEVAAIGFAEFGAELSSGGDRIRYVSEGRSEARVRLRLFTPVEPDEPDFILPVDFRIAGRTVATLRVPAAHPGHVLVVDLPGFAPSRLSAIHRLRPNERDPGIVAIAERASSLGQDALEAAAQAAIRTLVASTIKPKSTPAYKALAVAATNGVLRWEFDTDGVAFWVSVPDQWQSLLAAELLTTVAGEPSSLRQLGQTMTENRGQIRWVEDDGRSCDEPNALRLNSLELHSLVALFGENVLIRVLSTYTPDPADAVRRFVPRETSADARYQSVCAAQLKLVAKHPAGVARSAAFVEGEDGQWLCLSDILDGSGPRTVLARRADRVLWLSADRTAYSPPAPDAPPRVVRCTPFEMALLGELGYRSDSAGQGNSQVYDAALLCASELDEPGLVGAIGIAEDSDVPEVVLVDSSDGSDQIGSVARKFGVSGYLKVATRVGLEGRVVEEARRVMERALGRVASGGESASRLTEALLAFAVRHVSITDDRGYAVPAVTDPIALRVLRLPIFPSATGVPETAADLISRMRPGQPAPANEMWSPDRARFMGRLQALRDESVQFTPPAQEIANPELADWPASRSPQSPIDQLIQRLRPDEGPRINVVRVLGTGRFNLFLERPSGRSSESHSVECGPDHEAWEGEVLAGVCLLAYAKANEVLEEVTNEHEWIFQERITTALLDGELG